MAERFAYGRPLTADEDLVVHTAPRSTTALVGRILLSAIFLISGFAKLADPAGAVGYMNQAGVPNADTLVYVAGIAEILGGASLLLGLLARVGALGLIVYLAVITVIMHRFWGLADAAAAKAQMVQFTKNLAIMGGLFMVFSRGPGLFSIDARLRRPKLP